MTYTFTAKSGRRATVRPIERSNTLILDVQWFQKDVTPADIAELEDFVATTMEKSGNSVTQRQSIVERDEKKRQRLLRDLTEGK